MSSWGLSWLTSWASSWGAVTSGHAGPALWARKRPIIQRKKMMRALLLSRR